MRKIANKEECAYFTDEICLLKGKKCKKICRWNFPKHRNLSMQDLILIHTFARSQERTFIFNLITLCISLTALYVAYTDTGMTNTSSGMTTVP